jgi:hypothetical protein
MSRVPNTKLSDQWEKEVEHVSKLIISKFVHIRGHNKKNIMTSTKIQINFYSPPMARIDTYQYKSYLQGRFDIISSKNILNDVKLSPSLEGGLFFPRVHLMK